MLTSKELAIINALIDGEKEKVELNENRTINNYSLLKQYQCTLSGLEGKIRVLQKKQGRVVKELYSSPNDIIRQQAVRV